MYKETKARLQKTERQSYWKFIDNIIEVGDPDQEQQPKQKRFWAYIKSLRKDSSEIAPLKDNGTFHANPKDKADILNRQYESTWTKDDKRFPNRSHTTSFGGRSSIREHTSHQWSTTGNGSWPIAIFAIHQ